ncbi:hypothetical protein ADUPG1_011533, partial [Aduncisulcus paluster]
RTDTSAKVGRWFLSLSEYSFDIIHVAGAQNGAADCLSRLPIKKGPVKSQVLCVQPIGLEFDANNALVKELLELQKEYPVEEELEKTENGLLVLSSSALYIPEVESFRRKLIKWAHASLLGGHKGINATLKFLAKRKIKWAGIRKDISQFIKSCLVCQRERLKIDALKSYGSIIIDQPFKSIAVDTIGPFPLAKSEHRYCLSIIDEFTRYIEIFPTRTTKAEEAAKILYEEFILRFGLPPVIKSDNGPQFVNAVWRCLFNWLEIRHHRTIPYNPQSNGIIERSNRELLKFLKALLVGKEGGDWTDQIPVVRFLMNSQEHSVLGISPFEMVFGREPDEWRDIFVNSKRKVIAPDLGNKKTKEAAITFSEGLKEKLLALREKAIQLRSKSVSTVETSPVEEGSAVWLLPTKKNSKISPRLRGPFIVVSNLANNMISIRSLIEEATVMNVHIRRLIVVKGEHTHEELRNMAAASEGEYFIEALVDHR